LRADRGRERHHDLLIGEPLVLHDRVAALQVAPHPRVVAGLPVIGNRKLELNTIGRHARRIGDGPRRAQGFERGPVRSDIDANGGVRYLSIAEDAR